jgi:hypothetical protein
MNEYIQGQKIIFTEAGLQSITEYIQNRRKQVASRATIGIECSVDKS